MKSIKAQGRDTTLWTPTNYPSSNTDTALERQADSLALKTRLDVLIFSFSIWLPQSFIRRPEYQGQTGKIFRGKIQIQYT